jgi:hypothetical protein
MKEIGGIGGRTGDMRNAYKMSIPKPHWNTPLKLSRLVFLNRQAAARYRALASIIPGREKFSWNLSC